MAILREDNNGELRRLSNAEIKAQIQQYTGWTDLEYQREYAKFRNRLRNYESAIGQTRPTPANEQLYRILQKRATTGQISARNQAILNFSSASTRHFRERVQQGYITQVQQNLAIQSLVNAAFAGLLEKSETTRRKFDKWINEVVETKTVKDPETGNITRIEVLRSAKVTAAEINKFLGQQAKDLHARQAREYRANKARYASRRYVGSD